MLQRATRLWHLHFGAEPAGLQPSSDDNYASLCLSVMAAIFAS